MEERPIRNRENYYPSYPNPQMYDLLLKEVLRRAETREKMEKLQRQQQIIHQQLIQLKHKQQEDEREPLSSFVVEPKPKIVLPKLKEIPKKPKQPIIQESPPLLKEESVKILESEPKSPSSVSSLVLEIPSSSLLSGTSLLKLKKGILKNKKKRGPRKEPPKKCRLCNTDDVFIRPHRIFMKGKMWRLDDWLCKSCFLRRRRPWEFGEGGVVWARYGNEDEWWPAKILSLPQRGDSYETSTFEVTLIGKNWTGIVDYACIVPFTDTLYHGVTLDRKLEECIELAFVERQKHESLQAVLCKLCTSPNNPDLTLICDRCEAAYHTYCIKPPLDVVPEGPWYCSKCTMYFNKKRNGENPPKKQRVQKIKTLKTPKPPKLPKLPKLPKVPKAPKSPKLPKKLKLPKLPKSEKNTVIIPPIPLKRKFELVSDDETTEEENEDEVCEVDGFEITCSSKII